MKARILIVAFASMMLAASALSASAATRPTPARMEKGAPARVIGEAGKKKAPMPPAHKMHKKAKAHAHICECRHHRHCDRYRKCHNCKHNRNCRQNRGRYYNYR